MEWRFFSIREKTKHFLLGRERQIDIRPFLQDSEFYDYVNHVSVHTSCLSAHSLTTPNNCCCFFVFVWQVTIKPQLHQRRGYHLVGKSYRTNLAWLHQGGVHWTEFKQVTTCLHQNASISVCGFQVHIARFYLEDPEENGTFLNLLATKQQVRGHDIKVICRDGSIKDVRVNSNICHQDQKVSFFSVVAKIGWRV